MTKTTKENKTTAIPASTIKGFDKLIADGASNDKLEGFLLFEGIAKKDAIAYLKERGLIGAKTFRVWLTEECLKGFVGADAFISKIEGESNNTKKHIKSYDNERVAYNRIHAKYDTKIAALVDAESK